MKPIEWSAEKNRWLMRERGVSFEDVASKVATEDVLATIEHPNRTKYPHQKMYIIEIRGYIYQVPFVEDGAKIFLKTIIPDRKATRQFLENN